MAKGKSEIFVEKISEEFAHPVVGPSSVYQ